MNKKYFPGANSGVGFFSRFDGIVPADAEHHYTYVLKGGPGVGKNTLMKKVAKQAAQQGYEVEEFRCASDPKSLDAVRIPQMGVVILDGTSPHSIDPKVPGIDDEVIDLGHFKHADEFFTCRELVSSLLQENKNRYAAAYALLGAAHTLKKEAKRAVHSVVNAEKLHAFVSRLVCTRKHGSQRKLFARSATPDGIIDFSPSFLPDTAVKFSGIIGEIAMHEAENLLHGKGCEIFYDFVDPCEPRCIITADVALGIGEGGDTLFSVCPIELPIHVTYCIEKADQLVNRATSELAKALAAHDKIEEIYREYVDYDRVNEEGEKLLKRIGL